MLKAPSLTVGLPSLQANELILCKKMFKNPFPICYNQFADGFTAGILKQASPSINRRDPVVSFHKSC